MKIHEQLLSKNGSATIILAKELLTIPVGSRIPTVTELSETFGLVRGTTQNALKNLTASNAVKIEAKGHLGSFLVEKDNAMLLRYVGIDSLVGSMPLPYSRRYEGLASGIITAMESGFGLPVNLAFMRGAKNRIAMLLADAYDFAIVSRFAVEQFNEQYPGLIDTVINFGPETLLSRHAIMFHDPVAQIEDGMKVGYDAASLDQSLLTRKVCEGKNVEFEAVDYSNMIRKIENGDIDAGVMNLDEVMDKNLSANCAIIDNVEIGDTEAVLVVKKDNEYLKLLFNQLVDIEAILRIQKMVIEGTITPNY